MRFGFLSFIAIFAATAMGGAQLPGWGSDFHEQTNLVKQVSRPLVLLWTNKGCDHCETLEEEVQSPEFVAWRERSGYEFCFIQGINDSDPSGAKGAKNFALTAAGTRKKPTTYSYPLICFYWPKSDGSVLAKCYERLSASELMAKADDFFAGYTPKRIRFASDGSNVWDRYEAEPGHTEYVDVKIVQEGCERETYRFSCIFPDGTSGDEVSFSFQPGEAEHVIRVPIPKGACEIEKQIALSLKDSAGTVVATSSITFVDPENGSNNPLWSDERTVESLAWGEWTADMDTATQKVAQAEGDAWTLVELAGSLWCPDCYRTDVNFLEDGGKVSAWARERHIALVSVDTPHNSAADPDPANPVGTIWSRDTDATKLIIPPFENADLDKVERSGKGYLSRKMVSDEDALVVARRNLWLSKDYFHRPEDYASHRTLIPIFILLNKAGDVVGRFETFDARSQSPTNRAYTAQYLARFDEMIEMAKASADAPGEVTDNHWSTTRKTLAVDGVVSNGLSHADFQDVFRLDGLQSGRVTLDLRGTKSARMAMEVLEVRSGEAVVVASGYGNIRDGVSVSADVDASTAYYARVYCNKGGDGEPTDGEFASISTASTIAAYSVSAAFALVPGSVAFDDSEISIFTHEGAGEIAVTRRDGGSGAVSVRVKVVAEDEAASGCYEWADPVVSWGDGEQGTKVLSFKLAKGQTVAGMAKVTLRLQAVSSGSTVISESPLVITLVGSDEPMLEKTSYDVNAYLKFSGQVEFGVFNVRDPKKVKLTLAKESGRLPSGMKLKYDKATGKVVLSGSPKKTGDYVIVVFLSETRTTGKVVGETSTIRISVKDPELINPFVANKRDKRSYPLYVARDGGRLLVGMLDLAISSANKITAKYAGTESGSILFSGNWMAMDEDSGMASATLEKKGAVLALSMDTNGCVRTHLRVPETYSYFSGEDFEAECPFFESNDFSAYKGCYTVALPAADGSCGCGYLTLQMTSSSAVRTGKVKFSGMSPEGKSLSGYAYLMPRGEVAGLSVFKRVSSAILGADLEIKPNGSVNWNNPSDILSREVVNAADGTVSYWLTDTDFVACGVAGSWYKAGATMEEFVSAFYVNPKTAFRLVIGNEVIGTLVANGKKFDFDATGSRSKFSINAKTGVFSGKTGRGSFKGVLVLGWYENCDCGEGIPEFPFGSGTQWWSERRDGKSVKCSTTVSVQAIE